MQPETALEVDFTDLRRVRVSGGTAGERSCYEPLANPPNTVGATLKQEVLCVSYLAGPRASCLDLRYERTLIANDRSFLGQTLKSAEE